MPGRRGCTRRPRARCSTRAQLKAAATAAACLVGLQARGAAAQDSGSNDTAPLEFCDIVHFETEVIEKQNGIANLKAACVSDLADLVEHFGPPRDDMLLEVLCKGDCNAYHNSYLDLLESSGCTCQEAGSYDRYCFENRMALICEMPQLGMCNNFNEPHDIDICIDGASGRDIGFAVAAAAAVATVVGSATRWM